MPLAPLHGGSDKPAENLSATHDEMSLRAAVTHTWQFSAEAEPIENDDGRCGQAGKAAATTAEAALRAEVSSIVRKAASTVGNRSVRVSSRQVAEQAAREWVGAGGKVIKAQRGAGQVIGEISADGQRVARYTSANKASPYINLENLATGGNLHVRF